MLSNAPDVCLAILEPSPSPTGVLIRFSVFCGFQADRVSATRPFVAKLHSTSVTRQATFGKVIQGSAVGGQPKWSSCVQPKIAPSAFRAKAAAVPPLTAVCGRSPAAPPPPAFSRRHNRRSGMLLAVRSRSRPGRSGLQAAAANHCRTRCAARWKTRRHRLRGVRIHVGLQAERIGAIAARPATISIVPRSLPGGDDGDSGYSATNWRNRATAARPSAQPAFDRSTCSISRQP